MLKSKKDYFKNKEEYCHLYTCLINNNNKNGYLYIIFDEKIIIVDLSKRIIIKKIKLNINEEISSIKNWNNKYVILVKYSNCTDENNSFYIYDINKFQIITKYSMKGERCPIKTIYSKGHEFYGLTCFNTLFYNLKKSSNKKNI